ncbi:MAG: PD-(D/E)XK nuclease family protein, partial [Coriobacteriia bacterium]|nr:PD-(D/E)XK nuclease family protein [Coriobacteriia bacterium]
PRQWLYEHGVRPRGLDLEIDARRRGSMAHAMLQRFYVRWQEIGHARVTEADLDHALAVHAAVAEAVLADSPAPESLEERAEGERAVRGSRRVIERDASSFPGFAPIGHEVAFGGDDEGLDLGGWRISGRIDRIDAGEEGLVVMDYKSGEGRAWASFEKRGVLQAPLYALVAQRLYDRPVVGMLYRSMSAHQDRGAYIEGAVSSPWLAKADACDAATLDELVERAIQRASGAVEGIRAGRFPCEPAEREVCSWCVARTWCEGSAS